MYKRMSLLLMGYFIFHLFSIDTFAQASFQGLGDLPGGAFSSKAYGVSVDGSVVVGSGSSANGSEAFRWTASGGMVGLGDLPGGNFVSVADNVSADGSVVVGTSFSANGQEAFRWTAGGGMVGLGDLPGGNFNSKAYGVSADGSVVVGFSNSANGSEPFRWTAGGGMVGLGYLPGGNFVSVAFGISADGSVVVGYSNSANGDEAFRWTASGGMVGLGDLPGGMFNSQAFGVSTDGSVVVGFGSSANGQEAFRWTAGGGMVGLGDLPGGSFSSFAFDISADGSVVVGRGFGANGVGAFLWKDSDGMRSIQDILVNDYGLDLTGWTLLEAWDISADGTVIVGQGINPSGDTEGWRAVFPQIGLTSPSAGELWIAGTEDTIKWDGGAEGDLVLLEFSADSGNTFELIDKIIEADTGMFVWEIPDSILSTKCFIRIFGLNDTTIADTSDLFKIKGYRLTKLDENGDYELFLPHKDGWMFGNAVANMWPLTWWVQFNYNGGTDPNTDESYPQQFTSEIASRFPDWPLWVKTFGTDQCYWSTFFGIYKDEAIVRWKAANGNWNGSCYGFAGSSFLGFNFKDEFINSHPGIPQYDTLSSVFLTPTSRAAVNEYFIHQFGQAAITNDVTGLPKNPRQTLAELRAMFISDTMDIKTLSFFNPSGSGAHTVAPYKVERDLGVQSNLRVYVYDSNNPLKDNIFLTIDSLNNQWTDTQIFNPPWGTGNNKFYLEIPISNYLTNATLSPNVKGNQRTSGNLIEFYNSSFAYTLFISSSGDTIGYVDSVIVNTFSYGFPIIPKSGFPNAPIGYYIPEDNYLVNMSNFSDSSTHFSVFTDLLVYNYSRQDAAENQSDRLYYGESFSVSSDDAVIKNIELTTIVEVDSSERVFYLKNTTLQQNDSLDVSIQESDKLTFKNYGSSKSYDLRLKTANSSGGSFFLYEKINLAANSSHQIAPIWEDLVNTPVKVYIDIGIDGVIDDSLSIKNQITDVKDHGNLYIPNEYKLEQNYPNPFNPTTIISYSIPKEGLVTLKVYNAIGEEVAILANEVKQVGNYEIEFDASELSSGIYFYRLQAGDYLETKKMVLLK